MKIAFTGTNIVDQKTYTDIRGKAIKDITKREKRIYNASLDSCNPKTLHVFNQFSLTKQGIVSAIVVVDGAEGHLLNYMVDVINRMSGAINPNRQKLKSLRDQLKMARSFLYENAPYSSLKTIA